MKNLTAGYSRRNALQQMAAITIAAGLSGIVLPAIARNPAKKAGPLQPFYLPPAKEILQPGPGGINIRTWVRSTQTNNQFSCVEAAVAPKKMGPPPHFHKELDEICYVLEGTASVLVDGKLFEVEAGGIHLRPRGIEHTFFNGTDKPIRFMDLYFNQNFEDYLEEFFLKIVPDMVKNNLSPMDTGIAKRMAINDEKFGVTLFPQKRQAIVDKYGLIA